MRERGEKGWAPFFLSPILVAIKRGAGRGCDLFDGEERGRERDSRSFSPSLSLFLSFLLSLLVYTAGECACAATAVDQSSPPAEHCKSDGGDENVREIEWGDKERKKKKRIRGTKREREKKREER